ncbi:hypothetical protein EVG20_g2738 [Dentipellis fragilis]|uniref:Uncharacterized protein n=1 Tax=Dentipellis fragilis TaxID=205917 RepID=A0A4Y9Z8V4_9AGAM|nr:hypothetical protein EVG20_g2738 [Dentipellis fragilis]
MLSTATVQSHLIQRVAELSLAYDRIRQKAEPLLSTHVTPHLLRIQNGISQQTLADLTQASKLHPDRLFLAAAVIFVVLVIVMMLAIRPKRAPNADNGSLQYLRALQTVFIPTTSHWPPFYSSLARSSNSTRATRIPLSRLLQDLVEGTLELRNPTLSLHELLAGRLTVLGCRVEIAVDFNFRVNVSLWWMWSHYLTAGFKVSLLIKVEAYQVLSVLHHPSLSRTSTFVRICASSALPLPSLTVYVDLRTEDLRNRAVVERSLASSFVAYSLNLDYVPHGQLESLIRHLQAALSMNSLASLELATHQSTSSIFDPSFVLAAVPFLPPRPHADSKLQRPDFPTRTSMVLSASLPDVIGLLSSGDAPLTIASVANISSAHAKALDVTATRLERDPEMRSEFLENHTLEQWREEVLCLRWEAALLKIRMLTRWKILVRR